VGHVELVGLDQVVQLDEVDLVDAETLDAFVEEAKGK